MSESPSRDEYPPSAIADARLRILHEITLELSRAPDVSALCKSAVEMGISRLDFGRMAIWFLDPADPRWLVGTWGTDEQGRLRDERNIRAPRNPDNPDEQLYGGTVHFLVAQDADLLDNRGVVVGRGDRAAAPLWDGTRITGMLVADSFFSHRRLTPEDGEILALLARSIAHLSALKHTETALEEAYEAKAVLLSELRHRTKNSFALISSLLSIETARAKDPLLSETLRKLGDRVSVLTTLYDHLDASAGLGRIKLDEYLGRIAGDLIDGYDADGRGIQLERSLEPMEIGMARAVPLGLIVNELVTDSLKHAFPGGRQGLVSLALRREGENGAELSVSDDGIGLPADFSVSNSKGLGITLVDTLCNQIQAELSVEQGPGASFRVRFPIEAPV